MAGWGSDHTTASVFLCLLENVWTETCMEGVAVMAWVVVLWGVTSIRQSKRKAEENECVCPCTCFPVFGLGLEGVVTSVVQWSVW